MRGSSEAQSSAVGRPGTHDTLLPAWDTAAALSALSKGKGPTGSWCHRPCEDPYGTEALPSHLKEAGAWHDHQCTSQVSVTRTAGLRPRRVLRVTRASGSDHVLITDSHAVLGTSASSH